MKPSPISLLLLAGFTFPASAGDTPDPSDVIGQAQSVKATGRTRPEQMLTEHDQSAGFIADAAPPSSGALQTQPDEGKARGFDPARDPLNAKVPMENPEDIRKADIDAREKVGAEQRKLLETRYVLVPKFAEGVTMMRGKPVPAGPTARALHGNRLAK